MSSPSSATSWCHQAGATSVLTLRSCRTPLAGGEYVPPRSAPASPNCRSNSPCNGLTLIQGIPRQLGNLPELFVYINNGTVGRVVPAGCPCPAAPGSCSEPCLWVTPDLIWKRRTRTSHPAAAGLYGHPSPPRPQGCLHPALRVILRSLSSPPAPSLPSRTLGAVSAPGAPQPRAEGRACAFPALLSRVPLYALSSRTAFIGTCRGN